MRDGRRQFLIGMFGAVAVLWLYIDAGAGERIYCGKNHNLVITDLDMTPDPVERGQQVKLWRVSVQVDGSGECETNFELREKPTRELVAQKNNRILKPGLNRVQLEPDGKYRFRAREHCFEVLADIERTRKPVDSREGFCARETANGRWSLKERGDRPIKRNP
ncbi:MAG: hypothetical protein ACREQP_06335 [Candidatus Binatia bacterium]